MSSFKGFMSQAMHSPNGGVVYDHYKSALLNVDGQRPVFAEMRIRTRVLRAPMLRTGCTGGSYIDILMISISRQCSMLMGNDLCLLR